MSVNDRPALGLAGVGRVGETLIRLLHEAGYEVAAVWNRTPEAAQRVAEIVGATVVGAPDEVVVQSELTLLTVSDDAIVTVAAMMSCDDLTGCGIVHTSGAHGAESLSRLAAQGAMVGGLHPIYPFANVDTALRKLRGVSFGIEVSDDRLRGWLEGVVAALDGHTLTIASGQKSLYHAALVFASNYTVTLYSVAQRILESMGADAETAAGVLNPLVIATIANLVQEGVPDALTGPLVRADSGTLEAHLKSLRDYDPQTAQTYLQLVQETLPLLSARGVNTDAILHLLKRGNSDAIDHS